MRIVVPLLITLGITLGAVFVEWLLRYVVFSSVRRQHGSSRHDGFHFKLVAGVWDVPGYGSPFVSAGFILTLLAVDPTILFSVLFGSTVILAGLSTMALKSIIQRELKERVALSHILEKPRHEYRRLEQVSPAMGARYLVGSFGGISLFLPLLAILK